MVRRQAIARGLIALVWALADLGLLAVARTAGIGERSDDRSLGVLTASAVAGALLLVLVAAVNFRAAAAARAGELNEPAGRGQLRGRAGVLAWLCGVRLVAVLGVLAGLRALGSHDSLAPGSFLVLVVVALLDAAVALGIATATASATNQLDRRAPSSPRRQPT